MERSAYSKEQNRKLLPKALRGIAAVALLSMALHGYQPPAQAQEGAQPDQSCETLMFHYPHESKLPELGYITDAQIDTEIVSVAEAAGNFAENLDPNLDFSSLTSTAIGFAHVCDADDLNKLTSHGATDITAPPEYELYDEEAIQEGDVAFPDEDVLRIMQPRETWERGATGAKAGLNVVLIDTGVQSDHPELVGHISPVQKCFSEVKPGFKSSCPNGKEEDESAYINDPLAGHGTMMAGLVTTVSHGNVLPIQVSTLEVDANGKTVDVHLSGTSVVKAYDWVISSRERIAAVNASYGHSDLTSQDTCMNDNKLEAELIAKILQRGIVFNAASGNTPGLNFTGVPACFRFSPDNIDGLIGVGSSTKEDTMAFHTSMADWIKVLSPGEHVVSTFPGSSYVGGIGTSQSTALVSGAVQVVRDIYRDGSPAFVEKVLIDTGFVIPDDRVDTEGRPNGLSAARVDFGGIARRWEGDYIRAHPKDVIVLPAVQKKW
jgi:hypothetical protein